MGKKDCQVRFKYEDSHCLGDLGIWGFISDVGMSDSDGGSF